MKVKGKRPRWIPVAAGLIRRQDSVLVGLRPTSKPMGDYWEFPGGKMEAGEAPEQTLKRELQEELQIDAQVGDLRLATSHDYGDFSVLLLFYDVLFWQGVPRPLSHRELRWAKAADLRELAFVPANHRAVNLLLQQFGEGL